MGQLHELTVHMPMFRTYHNLASPGVAAYANPTAENWYLNYYINIGCNKIEAKNFDMRPEVQFLTNNPISNILDVVPFRYHFIQYDVLMSLAAMLHYDYFISFNNVDDYYVEGKGSYGKNHFLHDGLISGLDEDNGTLTLVAYDSTGIYRSFKTSYEGFMKGFQKGLESDVCKDGTWQALKMIGHNEIIGVKVEEIKRGINEYLNKSPCSKKELAQGIEVYDNVIQYVKNLIYGIKENINLKYDFIETMDFNFLMEHEICMQKRIKTVENILHLDNILSDEYAKIVRAAKAAHMYYIKYMMTNNLKYLYKVNDNLENIKEHEPEILYRFVHRIE